MDAQSLHLYGYHVWANQRWFDHLKKLPAELWHREMTGAFPTVSRVFAHIYVIDNVWLAAMSGKSFKEVAELGERLNNETKGIGLKEMERQFIRLSERYRAFLGEQRERMISLHHPHFGELKASLSDLVRHVVNHGTHHRGTMAAMLRQAGHTGVSTDYIFYLYFMRQTGK